MQLSKICLIVVFMKGKKMNEVKKDRYLFFISLVIFLLFVFLCTFSSHAASANSPQFPIYVENIDVTPYQTYINNTYGGFWNLSQNNVIGWGSQESGYYVQTFAIPQVADQVQNYLSFSPSNLISVYPDYDYNNNTITLTFTNLANDNYKPWRLISFYSNGTGPNYPYTAVFNQTSTINKGVYGSTGFELNYVSTTIYLTNNGAWQVDKPVFVNELIPVISTGHATPPDFTDNDLSVDDSILNPPTWQTPSNPPTFDSSNIPQSIYNIIQWGIADPNGPFNIIKNNMQNAVGWLVNVISGYGQAIINNIQYSIENLYDNFVSLFEPLFDSISGISDKLDYFFEPLDVDDVISGIEDTTLYSVISVGSDFKNTFQDYFNSITVPDTLVFHVPYTILTKNGVIDIDFSWYPGVRDSIVPWIIGFLYAGFGLAIFRSFPSIIHGVSGILQKGG